MLHLLVAGRPFTPWFAADDLPAELQRAFTFTSTTSAQVHGPGLFSVRRQLAVVLPRCYDHVADAAAQLDAAGHTLRVLRRYLADGQQRRSAVALELAWEPAQCGDVAWLLARVEVALLLWEDYRAHGPLALATQRISADQRGRIHWERTIARTVPAVSGLDVAYAEPVRTRHALQVDHPIARLHVETAEAAGHFLGAHAARPRRPPSAREALALLDRHERALFQDRHRRVADWLRRYYAPSRRSTDGEGDGDGVVAAGVLAIDFAYLWERMLFVALGSAERPLLPRGRYLVAAGASEHGARFVLDLLLEAEHAGQRVHLVLDAKDYQPGSLPQREAIYKQLLYRLLHFRQLGAQPDGGLALERIGNAFVGPAALAGGRGVRLHALHDLDGEEGAVAPLGRIVSLDVDFARVAAAYARDRVDARLRAVVVAEVMTFMAKGRAALDASLT